MMAAAMRPKIVLVNPPTVFWTMPLALLAVGSALDRARIDVVVVDRRFETDDRLLSELDDALCLGVTVLTGRPLAEAAAIVRRARRRRPDLPVIWGGWHPSLFPASCVEEGGASAAVVGQGEATFVELVDRLAAGQDLDGVAGCWTAGPDGEARANPPRPLQDLNGFPAHDYGLIDVEATFRAKGRRQLDYVTSQGCRFRCGFCADPAVFGRAWTGLEPARVLDELTALHRRHGFTDLSFQDETFFTSRKRVEAIAEGLLDAGMGFTWTAALRADQGRRLPDETAALCRRAGLREVVLGVESGSSETLRRIRKDITIDDVLATAEALLRHGIGAAVGIIVGFPDEPEESVMASLDMASRLAAMSPAFRVSIFAYQPIPGGELWDQLVAGSGGVPTSLDQWCDFDYVNGTSAFLEPKLRRVVESYRFYHRLAFASHGGSLRRPLRALARWRVTHHEYGLAAERRLVEWLRPGRETS